jgi:hypothetical protein
MMEYIEPGSVWMERADNGYVVHYTMCCKPDYAGPYDNVSYDCREKVFTEKERTQAMDCLDEMSGAKAMADEEKAEGE